MINALLFDKDGTLFDFHKTWGGWASNLLPRLADGDEAIAEDLAQRISFDRATSKFGRDSLVISDTPDMIAEALSKGLPDRDLGELTDFINQTAAEATTYSVVDLPAVLAAFQSDGLALGVATNDAEVAAKAHLSRAGVSKMFDFVAGSDSGYGGKPATGMQMAFCQALGLAPAQVAMVGDSAHDLVAGRDAGMTTIGVLTGPAEVAELEPLADVVLQDIGEIGDWLKISANSQE
jgi:phosphoglycolate phosphatase